MAWENIDQMFPQGGVEIDGEWISNQDLIDEGMQVVSYIKIKPVRSMVQEMLRYTYTADGNFTIAKEYDIFPQHCIDGVPLLNAYAQKEFNDFCHDIRFYDDVSNGTYSGDMKENTEESCECNDCNTESFDNFLKNGENN